MKIITLVLSIPLFLSSSLWAKSIYLKDGSEIECQSYRQEGDSIIAQINSETALDFALEEVDFTKTAKAKVSVGKKKQEIKRTANANPEMYTLQEANTTEQPPEDITWWGAGKTPDGYNPGTPEVQKELFQMFEKYNQAARSGDFTAVARYMTTHQAQGTLAALAKVKDKKVLQQRRKVLQSLAVKDFHVQKCAVSPDGKIAALAGVGKKQQGGTYQEAKGTIKLVKESSGWKVALQVW
ncbi:hypothetical protein [Geotalea toluenoxydans]|uniref:hypothetical protein n=1 Tax=Geotalea toluenoxydans TaxID=421624 RepID=UPI0006D0E1D2|nr:hypothetical protein [Geotalea toluenoxydans]